MQVRAIHRNRIAASARGMTFIELMISVLIVGVLTAIALAGYQNYRERIRLNQAITDISAMSVAIKHYMIDNPGPPASLADVNLGNKIDPWGRPYFYLNLTTLKGNGKSRRDRNLNPLNSDFDLYSAGKDGQTQTQLNAPQSRDDVIRARDGKFVGLAADFDP
jgi:general secretion pathway protein G